jgi:hypothetical protein
MRAKWLRWIRQFHTWLGVFFSPLLLLFIATGWWQTFTSEDDREKEKDMFNSIMARFSTIHTDDYFSGNGSVHHASEHFKLLVGTMSCGLMLSVILGLALAFQGTGRARWAIVALAGGIVVPAALLYLG